MEDEPEMPTIRLPSSAEKFQEIMQLFVAERILTRVNGELPNDFQKILKYALPSLTTGRAFNHMKIIVAGDERTYKRSVISLLIDNVLEHTPVKVTPSSVRYYSDTLQIPDGDAKIEVGVSIDVLDVCKHINHRIENHLANASRTYIPDRGVRKITPELRKLVRNCRPVEYPNLVLYFASNNAAINNPKEKNILNFQLSQLHKMNLVDIKANNLVLIIVSDDDVTKLNTKVQAQDVKATDGKNDNNQQEASSSTSTTKGTQTSQEQIRSPLRYATIQNKIRKQLKDVYGLTGEVPVLVFAPNSLDYKPGERLSNSKPFATTRATILGSIEKVMTKNNDSLGLLFLSALYNNPDCTTTALETINATMSLDATALHSIFGHDHTDSSNLYRGLVSIPTHNGFHSIGQAYCPVSESLKLQNVFSMDEMKSVFVGETMFYVPEFVDMFLDVSTESWSLTHDSKKLYEAHRKSEYGIEKGVTLKVDKSLSGNWRSSSNTSDSSDAVLHEVRLAFLQVVNPEKYFSPEFRCEVRNLAKPIENVTNLKKSEVERIKNERYNSFFAKWGTHFVVKQWIGGYIKTDWTENNENSNNSLKILGNLAARLLNIDKVHIEATSKASLFSVKKGGKLAISGHEHDDLMYLEFDKITPELYYGWVNEVKKNPNALNYSFVLYPYYNMNFCDDKEELRRRTLKYLSKNDCEGCFPASTMIRLSSGQEISIGQLNTFDSLLTVNVDSVDEQNCTSTRMLTFLHLERNKKANFLVLIFSNGKCLKVTDNHLLFVLEQSHSAPTSKPAKHMNIGDKMFYVGADRKILTTTLQYIEVEECYGVFCPLTSSGSFLANGFLVTSYASVDNFNMAHKAMAPLRIWCDFKLAFNTMFGKKQKEDQPFCQGVHDYAKLLVWIRSFILNE